MCNADKSGLYQKMLPDKTLAVTKDAHNRLDHKQAKNRLTILSSCSGTGTSKLKPLVVGKCMSPRCFHHANMDILPVIYRLSARSLYLKSGSSTNLSPVSRVTRDLTQPEKATIHLDNCSAHP